MLRKFARLLSDPILKDIGSICGVDKPTELTFGRMILLLFVVLRGMVLPSTLIIPLWALLIPLSRCLVDLLLPGMLLPGGVIIVGMANRASVLGTLPCLPLVSLKLLEW